MTRRDFELIARAVSAQKAEFDGLLRRKELPREAHEWAVCALINTAQNLARELGNTNPRFDRARFMKACGFGEG